MQNEFKVWNANKIEDYRQWIEEWQSWPKHEVFAHPEYMKLYCNDKIQPLCASWKSLDGNVLYPFFMRDLREEPFFPEDLNAAYDMVSPYGYGGPFFWGKSDPSNLAKDFWAAFENWVKHNNVVSEFIRFSLQKDILLPYPGEIQELLQNVVLDLNLSEETIWRAFEHKVRKNVNKAKRSGVSVIIDINGDHLDDFLSIYNKTMDRRKVNKNYYFSEEYFQFLNKRLSGQITYFHAIHDGKIISTELVLISAENIYSFLGGTDESAYNLRPNELLKYEIINWGQKNKKARFVLGGGYEPNDGIFRYKKSYAPNNCIPFFVGKRIFQTELYKRLIEYKRLYFEQNGKVWMPNPRFFPTYRA